MEHILKIEALTKQYNRHNVIDNVNMSVQAGAIYGLIGRNGTGKTTILKIIGGLAKPSSGKICLSDNTEQNGGQDALRIGVLIEQAGIYPDMSARQINFIISSHILGELSKIATDYVIIHNGVLIEQISKILYAVAVTNENILW